MSTSLSVGTRLRGGMAGSHRDRGAMHNFPRNMNIIKASWIRRGGKCWRCLWVELQNTRHSLRTPRIAGKKFAMGCRSLWMHQDRGWRKWLLCSCYPDSQDSDVGNVGDRSNTNRILLTGQIRPGIWARRDLDISGLWRTYLPHCSLQLTPDSTETQPAPESRTRAAIKQSRGHRHFPWGKSQDALQQNTTA